MGTFFEQMTTLNEFESYYKILDWIFNDSKFLKFTPQMKAKLTKKFKQKAIGMLSLAEYTYGTPKRFTTEAATNYNPKIQMLAGESESVAFITHIRNGIAHGHAKIKYYKNETYLRIVDYRPHEKGQTAFIFIPLAFLKTFYSDYQQCGVFISKKQKKPKKGKR